jgi:hypothetical protein
LPRLVLAPRNAVHVLILFVLALTGSAWADSITIGSIQYLGTNPQGQSAFKVILNTSSVSAPLMVSDAALSFAGTTQTTGSLTTPATLLFMLPGSGSGSALFQLSFGSGSGPVTIILSNGKTLTVSAVKWTKLMPFAGEHTLHAGQTVPITLTTVPEPASLVLFGTGLASISGLARRRARLASTQKKT